MEQQTEVVAFVTLTEQECLFLLVAMEAALEQCKNEPMTDENLAIRTTFITIQNKMDGAVTRIRTGKESDCAKV